MSTSATCNAGWDRGASKTLISPCTACSLNASGNSPPSPTAYTRPETAPRECCTDTAVPTLLHCATRSALSPTPYKCGCYQKSVSPASRCPQHGASVQRLGFETRIRPVTRPRGEGRRGHREQDAFLAEINRHHHGTKRDRAAVYAEWLADNMNRHGGAVLDNATLVAYRRTRLAYAAWGRPQEGPEAIMRGTLSVTSREAFTKWLARGVGRHLSYGYGMMLLRPLRD